MQQSRCRPMVLVAVLALSAFGLGAAAVESDATNIHAGVTRPSEERALSFSYPGVVREVFVKEGDKVKVGQPVLKLDDRLDRNAMAQAEIDANSLLKIEYARKSLAQKKIRLEVAQDLRQRDAGTAKELEEAELNVDLAYTQLKLEEEQIEAAKLKAAGLRIKVELAQLSSTIDGIVQKINVKEGEYSDPQQSQRAACIVVKNDPLKVEVFLPAATASKLKEGQSLDVAYAEEEKWTGAKITFFDPVADAGSGMRRLNLELPNPGNRESGLQVKVRVPGQ